MSDVILQDIGLKSTDISSFICEADLSVISCDAFKDNTKLTIISVPNARAIDSGTFSGCSSLVQLTLPGISSYDRGIFLPDVPASLQKIEFRDGVKKLNGTLRNLSSLREIQIPATLETFISGELSGCGSIQQLSIGISTEVQENAFKGMASLVDLYFPMLNGNVDFGLSSLCALTNVYVKSSSSFELNHFPFSMSNVENVILDSDNLTSLGASAFMGCSKLLNISLSNSQIDEIPDYAFYGCSSLNKLDVDENTISSIGLNSFLGSKVNNIKLNRLTSVKYPGKGMTYENAIDGVQNIYASAFYQAMLMNSSPQLSNVSILEPCAFMDSDIVNIGLCGDVTSIPESCFMNCTYLSTMICPGINLIGEDAFKNSGIQKFEFDNVLSVLSGAFHGSHVGEQTGGEINISSVKCIQTNSFKDCLGIKTVILDASLSSDFQLSAFSGCQNIQIIDARSYTVQQLNDSLSDVIGQTISVDRSSTDSYRNTVISSWGAMASAFGLLSSTSKFVMKLHDVTLNKTGTKSEWNCLSLDADQKMLISVMTSENDYAQFKEQRTVPETVLSIGIRSFDDAKNDFDSLSAQNVQFIDNGVFSASLQLSTIYVPQVTCAGASAFSDCLCLFNDQTMNFQHLARAGENAFSGCKSLTSINFTDLPSLLSVPARCFENCTNLISVDMRGNNVLSSIQPYAFNSCSQLTTFVTPDSPMFSTFGQYILSGCASLCDLSIQTKYLTSLSPGALEGVDNTVLSVTFANVTDADNYLSIQETSGSNGICSPVGTKFFTACSHYKNPQYFTTTDDVILKVCHNAFVVSLSDDNALVLQGFDSNALFDDISNRKDIILSSNFDNISYVSGTAFSGSQIQVVKLPSRLIGQIGEGVFSEARCNKLKTVYIDVDFNSTIHSTLWSYLGDDNLNLVLRFNNGMYDKYGWHDDDDVFESYELSGVDTIYDVIESNVPPNGNVIISAHHKAIAPYTFFKDSKITYLDTNEISNISDGALSNNISIKEIVLNDNIKIIGHTAFSSSGVSSINIPSSVVSAEGYGLNESHFLSYLHYDDGLKCIVPSAMIDCKPQLTSIYFPSSLTSIGEYAFAETHDQFPQIMNMNFDNASGLSVIEKRTFYNSVLTYDNNHLTLPPNVLSIHDEAFAYNFKTYTTVLSGMTLASSTKLEYIGPSAFMFNFFKEIDLSRSHLKEIGDDAFAFPKYKYTIAELPSSLKRIGRDAFRGNKVLNPDNIRSNMFVFDKNISEFPELFEVEMLSTYEAPNIAGFTDYTVLSAKNGDYYSGFAFILHDKMNFCPENLSIDVLSRTLVKCDETSPSAFVQSYLTSVSPQAFLGCTSLDIIKMPYLIDIQESAFYDCSSLMRIELIDDGLHESAYMIQEASDYQFFNCSSLSSVHLLSTATRIGECAFFNNDQLFDAYDAGAAQYEYFSLSSIGNSAFMDCDNLTSFSFGKNLQMLGDNVFDECKKLKTVNFRYFTSDQFADILCYTSDVSAAVISKFGGIGPGPQCKIVFSDVSYTNDGYVVIDNDKYVSLRDMSGNLSAVSSLNFDEFVNSDQDYLNLCAVFQVDDFVFCDVEKLQSISFIPDSVTGTDLCVIGDYAFANCVNLHNVNGQKLRCKDIGCYAFANDVFLTKFKIDIRSIEHIGLGAFAGTGLHEIEFYGNLVETDIDKYLSKAKDVIGWSIDNRNPAQLPETCYVVFRDDAGKIIGKYDYLLNDLIGANIDIGMNAMTFVDKQKSSIKPLLLLKPQPGCFTALAQNAFHMNVIGRWK